MNNNISFICENCGKIVSTYRSPSNIKKQPPRFCSLTCLGISQRGDKNPAYTGGKHLMANGYYVILCPNHPKADQRGYVYEHRMVAEGKLGRYLKKGETVHHVNRIKTDNSPENIDIYINNSAHMKENHHPANTNPCRGENHGKSILTEKKVREIRARIKEGETQVSLSKEYGVSRSTICGINKGISWKQTI